MSGHGPADSAPPEIERRGAQRLEVLGTLRAEVLVSEGLEITEISAAGLQVVSDFPFQLDSLHEFRLTLDQQTLVVKGRITHCSVIDVDQERVRYRSGVNFAELGVSAGNAIAAHMAHIGKRRLGADASSI